MTFDAKLPHHFLLIKDINRDVVLHTQIIQKTISKHHPLCDCKETSCGCRETSIRLSTYHCKLFFLNLNVLKLELNYEMTPPQMFFSGYHVLQAFCQNVVGACDIRCRQN